MKQVITAYGHFLLEGIVLVLLLVLLFCGIRDEEGNVGVFNMTGARLSIEHTDYQGFIDFRGAYVSEASKSEPEFFYDAGNLSAGIICLADCIKAVDYAGNELSFWVDSVKAPDGREIADSYNADTKEIYLGQAGIYEVALSVCDSGNRVVNGVIFIPVNQ